MPPIDIQYELVIESATNFHEINLMDISMRQEDITLRPLTTSDIASFANWATDSEVTSYLMWETYSSHQEMAKFLKEVVMQHPWFMAIIYKGKVVGSITLEKGKGTEACRAELGYVLAKEYWGKGIATKAVKQALSRGFQELSVNRIESFISPENIASIRVCEKAGMKREGLLKNYLIHKGKLSDRYVYAISIDR